MSATLKDIRRARGLTLHQVAQRLGVHFTAVHKWEARGVPAGRALRLAEVLDVPPHALRPDIYPPPEAA